MIWIPSVFVLIVILFLAVDGFYQLNLWQSRIKIGRYANRLVWESAIKNKAVVWLKKTPTAKLTDNERLILWDMIRGNYRRSTIQIWQKAALIIGLTDYAEQTNDDHLRKQITAFVNLQFTSERTWKSKPTEIDWVMMAHAIIRIPWLEVATFKPAFDETIQLIESLKGSDGLISYKKHTQSVRFVDTLGFICPFLTEYGNRFHAPQYIDLAVNQLNGFHKNGMMPQFFIPCHTYTTQTAIPVGLFGWGRGLGWYAFGLLDTYQALPEAHASKKELEIAIHDFAMATLPFQNENGSWNWLIFDGNARRDSSITAVMAWYLSSIPDHLQNETTKKGAQKAVEYLMKVTRRDGAIDFSQGDTKGIGIHAQTFEILPFTQGFALRILR